jgi:hypothetical protein
MLVIAGPFQPRILNYELLRDPRDCGNSERSVKCAIPCCVKAILGYKKTQVLVNPGL